MRLLASALVSAQILACAPVYDTRGYIFDGDVVAKIEKNTTTRDTLIAELGSPTSTSAFGESAVYYIQSRFVTESYRAPEETDRKVLAVYFDAAQKVRDYAIYGLDDGIIVPIVQRTTQTQGQELSAIAQIFSNLGRFEGEE